MGGLEGGHRQGLRGQTGELPACLLHGSEGRSLPRAAQTPHKVAHICAAQFSLAGILHFQQRWLLCAQARTRSAGLVLWLSYKPAPPTICR